MKIILFLLSSLLLGCSSVVPNEANNNLKDSFSEYVSLYGTSSEKSRLKNELWNTLVKARNVTDQSAFVSSLNSLTKSLPLLIIKKTFKVKLGVC